MAIIFRRADAGSAEQDKRKDQFTREQVDKAIALMEEYERVIAERAENREVLRRLAALGKLPTEKVHSIYAPHRRRRH